MEEGEEGEEGRGEAQEAAGRLSICPPGVWTGECTAGGARALRHRDWLQMSERGGADWEERAGGKR